MKIAHLLFDADGVLQTWLPGTLEHLRGLPKTVPAGVVLEESAYEGPNGPQDPMVSGFLQAVFAAEAPCLRGEADFSDRLQPVLAAWGVEQPLAQVLQIWRAIQPYPDMFRLIEQLRTHGVQCHLATNQQPTRAAYMRSDLGYDDLFDRSFYSCDLGVAKPDPEYFRLIVQQLDATANQVLFVDDRADNVAAAVGVGLEGLHFEARLSDSPSESFIEACSRWQLPLA